MHIGKNISDSEKYIIIIHDKGRDTTYFFRMCRFLSTGDTINIIMRENSWGLLLLLNYCRLLLKD